ncbi:integrase [Apibacter muscae]|uniref:tyrosine-type recombinase/integrase n=1 Tax=Apibacter muscae TaxID=2509004 RepID=UPI0011ACD96A|nr:tyrosine-type recombinase/integrase [Apibacter muscae]TWP29244.1 integrase [Apibacter muscae]
MVKVKFLLRNPKAGRELPIHIRLTDGRKVDIWGKTKESTTQDNWDANTGFLLEEIKDDRGRIKRSAEVKNQIIKNKEVNRRLLELKNLIEDSYKSNKTEKINSDWLKNIINPKIELNPTNDIPNELVKYIDYYVKQKGLGISKALTTKSNAVKKILERFKKVNKISELLIEDINNNFKVEFEKFCQNEKYAQNYTARNIKFIKTICYDAESNGLKVHFQLKKINSKIEKSEIIYLNFNELEQIEKYKQPHEYLDNARDWLIISCYTGQRVSDFMNFRKEMLRKEKEMIFIDFTQQKTGKIMSLALHPKVLQILKKRNGNFPRKISDQKYNEYIKLVCKNAEITEEIKGSKEINKRKVKGNYPKYELVTSHIGRRSFASNFFGEIPTPLIMVATGHSTERMLLNYIGKTNTQQSIALAEYFEKLS